MANRTPANSGRRRRSVPASWFYLHVHTRSTTAPGTINACAYAAICRAQLAAADGDAKHGNGKRAARRTRQQTRRWPATEGWPAAARRSSSGGYVRQEAGEAASREACACGVGGTGTKARVGPPFSSPRVRRKKKILDRIGPQLDYNSEIGPNFRTVFRRFTKTSESFAYELRLERFSRLRVRIVEGNNLQSKFERKLEPTGVVVASPSEVSRRNLEARRSRVLQIAFRRSSLLDGNAWKDMMRCNE